MFSASASVIDAFGRCQPRARQRTLVFVNLQILAFGCEPPTTAAERVQRKNASADSVAVSRRKLLDPFAAQWFRVFIVEQRNALHVERELWRSLNSGNFDLAGRHSRGFGKRKLCDISMAFISSLPDLQP